MPGADLNLVHSWADLLQKLLGSKNGSKPKLVPTDVPLDWRSLWRVLQKELWPKKSIASSSRNAINLFLFVAEKSRRYYPSSDIPAMLDVFLPLITKSVRRNVNLNPNDPDVPQNASIMLPTMISFLPHAQADLYLPLIFSLWEAVSRKYPQVWPVSYLYSLKTNSSAIDDRIIELLSQLAEKRVTTKPEDVPQEEWTTLKDVGIFSLEQWTIVVNKCLGSFRQPIVHRYATPAYQTYRCTNRFYQGKPEVVCECHLFIMFPQGPSNTSLYADSDSGRASNKPKKTINRLR